MSDSRGVEVGSEVLDAHGRDWRPVVNSNKEAAMRDVGSAQELNQLLVEAIESLKAYDPEKIILFGSYARGEWDPYSDIDLVIIKRTDKRFVQRLVEAGSYLNLPISVDLFVYSPEEFQAMAEEGNPFIERVLREGRTLYERSPKDRA